MEDIKGCIFDLDGVIVDTAKYHYLAWKKLADSLCINFNEHDNERFKGVSRMKCMEILLELGDMKVNEETKIKLADLKNSWYLEYIAKIDESEILPGVLKFMNDIRNAGIRTALGSASKNAGIILNNIKMSNYFDVIVDGNKVTKAKPDPEVFLMCSNELGLPPSECIVFEDAAAGVQAAKNGGMHAVGIGSPKILKYADVVIPNFKGITLGHLLQKLNY